MEKTEKELIKAFQDDMWLFWAGGDPEETPPCIRCWEPAVTLHEDPPRSLWREWYIEGGPETCFPVCADCHEWAHQNGDAASIEIRVKVVERLQTIGGWKPDRIVREIDETDV